MLLYSESPQIDQVIVDFDLDKATFSFIDKQEMIRALGIKPRNERSTADYLIDFFVLSGALFNQRLSTFQMLSMEQIIEKMNEFEAKYSTSNHSSTG